jgi:hypothetical protein
MLGNGGNSFPALGFDDDLRRSAFRGSIPYPTVPEALDNSNQQHDR